jgi:hypothetical protein
MSAEQLMKRVKDRVMDTGADEFGPASVTVSDETLVPLQALEPLAEAIVQLQKQVHKLRAKGG